MNVINIIFGVPLGFIIHFAYLLTESYGVAILIFAVIVRIVLIPVNVLAHKNSIRLLQLQPSLSIIKRRYSGDKDQLHEEQNALFKKEKYNPLIGIVPLLVQLVLVIGMLQVMYHPLQHMLRLDSAVINVLVEVARGLYGDVSAFREQLLALDAVQNPANLAVFQAALAGFNDSQAILDTLLQTELRFIGINLGKVPSLVNPSPELFVILSSGVASLAFCLVQNAISPGALSQSNKTNLGLTIFTVGLGVYFAAVTPAGVGLYWTVMSFLNIVVVLLLNILYNPLKLAGDAVRYLKANRKTGEELREDRELNKILRSREKVDAERFIKADKKLVFYAISGGQYKYYKTTIEYILANSEVVIHYLTNDPEDALFKQENPRLIPYYAGQRKTISLMLKLDTDMMVTTVPDLQTYHMKRSIVRDDIEYVYVFHASTSTHMIYREKAFDYFDTIFCVGPHHVAELRRREEIAKLPRRTLVKAGYVFFDQLIEKYTPMERSGKPRILIAPSWQRDNILEGCIDAVLTALKGHGYEIIVRPHPQFAQLFRGRLDELERGYADSVSEGELVFELDFASSYSIFESDVLITDWSAISYEFTYCTSKPCVFINTPMKVMNPNWEQYGIEPMDITLRDKIGVSIDIEDIPERLSDTVTKMLAERESYKERIHETLMEYIYHPGRSAEASGKYIVMQLEKTNR